MFKIIAEAISVAARASEPRKEAPRREEPPPAKRPVVWPRLG